MYSISENYFLEIRLNNLNNLRSVDDIIILMAPDLSQVQIMLEQVNEESSRSWSQDELINDQSNDNH